MPSGWFEQDLDPMSGKTTQIDARPHDETDHTSNLGKISRDLQRLVAIMEKDREDAAKRTKSV